MIVWGFFVCGSTRVFNLGELANERRGRSATRHKPYGQSLDEALAALATEAELGPTEDEARARLERYGRNELTLLFSRYFPGDAINPTRR